MTCDSSLDAHTIRMPFVAGLVQDVLDFQPLRFSNYGFLGVLNKQPVLTLILKDGVLSPFLLNEVAAWPDHFGDNDTSPLGVYSTGNHQRRCDFAASNESCRYSTSFCEETACRIHSGVLRSTTHSCRPQTEHGKTGSGQSLARDNCRRHTTVSGTTPTVQRLPLSSGQQQAIYRSACCRAIDRV